MRLRKNRAFARIAESGSHSRKGGNIETFVQMLAAALGGKRTGTRARKRQRFRCGAHPAVVCLRITPGAIGNIAVIKTLIATLTDTRELEEEEASAGKELETVSESMRKLVDAYAHALMEQVEYNDRYAELLAKSRAIEERIAEIAEQREQRKARKRELDAFCKALKATGPILEFDEELWNVAVESVTISTVGEIMFYLRTT